MLLWGGFGYLATLVPADLGREVAGRLAKLRVVAMVLAVATTLLALPIEVATVGDGWPASIGPETVGAVLLQTSLGRAWILQLVAALALAATTALPRRMCVPATASASGLLLALLASQGHAVMQEGWTGAVHRVNAATHVLAAGAWLGALVPLLPIVGALNDPGLRDQAGAALRRFSGAGHLVVALVIATGIANTALTLGRWPTDPSSPYQAMLALKIVLVAVMAGLAIVNRYVVVPRLSQHQTSALDMLRTSTIAEVGLGLSALACVSVFGLMEPS